MKLVKKLHVIMIVGMKWRVDNCTNKIPNF